MTSSPSLRHGATPFDRTADTRPLFSLVVDAERIIDEDQAATDRVMALAELPLLEIRRRHASEPWGRPDVVVASRALFGADRAPASVAPTTALDLVRLLLVNLGLYHVRRDFTVNEGLYYLYRFKSVFRAYQPAWSAATYGKVAISEDVREQLSSLGTRLEFLCRAADRGGYFALRRADNDNQDNALYHLAYFVMLTTGMFDDLAWVLMYLYKLKLPRMQVVLKTDPAGARSPFVEALSQVAPTVAAQVADPALQSLIRPLYPVRDRLQHRQFLNGLLYVGGPWGEPRILFEFPPEAVAQLRSASADGRGTEWGLLLPNDPYIDPYLYLRRTLAAAASVHDAVLGAIDWPELLGPHGTPERDAAAPSLARFRQGVAAFLDWYAEPLYF